ncbi:MAG: Holliday junction resolvase RuvX [Planctomycetaceae bacterium]
MTHQPVVAQDLIPDGFPTEGVLLGIDFGTKRVGVAVSDMYQRYSSPLRNYDRQSKQADEHFFRTQALEFRPVGIVVGLPVHMSGEESQKSREARAYAQWLSRLLQLPVAFQDERFTSAFAEAILLQTDFSKKQRKARVDKLAAQILLQCFLDARRQAVERSKNLPHADREPDSLTDGDLTTHPAFEPIEDTTSPTEADPSQG